MIQQLVKWGLYPKAAIHTPDSLDETFPAFVLHMLHYTSREQQYYSSAAIP